MILARYATKFGRAFANTMAAKAHAVEDARVIINDSEVGDFACDALKAIEEAGGPDGLTYEKMAEIAVGHFVSTQRQVAEEFAAALDEMINLDVTFGPHLACALKSADAG